MAIGQRGERRSWCWIAKGLKDVLYSREDEVVGRCNRHGKFGREPLERVAGTCCSGFPHPYGVTPIRFEGRASVPAIGAMRRPGSAFAGFDVGEDANAWRGEWGAVAIESAMDLGVGGEFRIDA